MRPPKFYYCFMRFLKIKLYQYVEQKPTFKGFGATEIPDKEGIFVLRWLLQLQFFRETEPREYVCVCVEKGTDRPVLRN